MCLLFEVADEVAVVEGGGSSTLWCNSSNIRHTHSSRGSRDSSSSYYPWAAAVEVVAARWLSCSPPVAALVSPLHDVCCAPYYFDWHDDELHCCCTSHDSRDTARNARSVYYSLHIANLLRLALLSALSVDRKALSRHNLSGLNCELSYLCIHTYNTYMHILYKFL